MPMRPSEEFGHGGFQKRVACRMLASSTAGSRVSIVEQFAALASAFRGSHSNTKFSI